MTPTDLGVFFDTLVPTQLERNDVAGAIVTVVRDGRVLFSKGYGWADVDARKPVSAEQTLFRIGSVSKLFAWTSVMQLVEQGKLDLDADVNHYIDFRIPETYGQPITLRQLMTHTAGFEETIQQLFVADAAHIPDLRTLLAARLPARIFRPGETAAYSNYGATLAAYVVERVSGEPYPSYVQRHILDPLRMGHTTLAQPVPAALAELVSKGYDTTAGHPHPFEVVGFAPAGSVSATAADMARFMIANLQGGQLDGARILRADTLYRMQARSRSFDPKLNGMCLGFYEESTGSLRIIGHGGDTLDFHTDLHLIPSENLGFFVSYNSAGNHGVGGRTYLFRRFLERYFGAEAFPAAGSPTTRVPGAKADAARVEGWYRTSRRGETNLLAMGPLGDQEHVTATADGDLKIDSIKGLDDRPLSFRETEPGLWTDTNGYGRKLVFKPNAAGAMTYSTNSPIMEFERVGISTNAVLTNILLFTSLGIGILAVALWPVAAMARRHYGVPRVGRQEAGARWASRGIALVIVVLAATTLASVTTGSDYVGLASPLFERLLAASIACAWLCAVAVVPAAWLAYRALRAKGLWWGTRIQRVALLAACLGIVYICYFGSVLRFNVAY